MHTATAAAGPDLSTFREELNDMAAVLAVAPSNEEFDAAAAMMRDELAAAIATARPELSVNEVQLATTNLMIGVLQRARDIVWLAAAPVGGTA
jgi:hypothetical protein